MEITLDNRIKINSFKKMKKVLKGETPDVIRVTKEQYEQYRNLFPYTYDGFNLIRSEPMMTFNGVKLLLCMEYFKGFDMLPK